MTLPARAGKRPAEVTGAGGAVATAVAALLGADVETVAVIGTVAGLLPACVTYVVAHGGIRGVLSAFWRGR